MFSFFTDSTNTLHIRKNRNEMTNMTGIACKHRIFPYDFLGAYMGGMAGAVGSFIYWLAWIGVGTFVVVFYDKSRSFCGRGGARSLSLREREFERCASE